jgi:hypothetical protein
MMAILVMMKEVWSSWKVSLIVADLDYENDPAKILRKTLTLEHLRIFENNRQNSFGDDVDDGTPSNLKILENNRQNSFGAKFRHYDETTRREASCLLSKNRIKNPLSHTCEARIRYFEEQLRTRNNDLF